MPDLFVTAHVTAGAVGLAVGPAAALARRKARGWHTAAGWMYQACCAVLCTTALAFVVLDPSLWPFALIAVGTQLAAVAAVVVRRRRRRGWIPLHVQLALSSYVSFVTAFSVQTFDGALLAWVVPVALGSTVVSIVTTRVARAQTRAGQRTAANASGSVKAPA
jgi:hypothetical protein